MSERGDNSPLALDQITADLSFRSATLREKGDCALCGNGMGTRTAVFAALGTEATVTMCRGCEHDFHAHYRREVLGDGE